MNRLKKAFVTTFMAASVLSVTVPVISFTVNNTEITAEAATKSEKKKATKKLKSKRGMYDDGTYTFLITDDTGSWGFSYVKFGLSADVNSLQSYKKNVMTFKNKDASGTVMRYKLKFTDKSIVLYCKFPDDKKYEKYSTFKYSTREKE